MVEPAIVDDFIAATPALSALDVHGHDVFSTFAHPALRRLRITGHGALRGMFEEYAPMPGVETLDLALDQPYDQDHWTDPAPQLICRATSRSNAARAATMKIPTTRTRPTKRTSRSIAARCSSSRRNRSAGS